MSDDRERGAMSEARPVAELLADRGAATESEEFFRSRPFLDAEGVTHTLRIATGDAELLAPLLVREIPGGGAADAISPYGYPGFSAHPPIAEWRVDAPIGSQTVHSAIDPTAVDFSPTGLVSAFLRHSLGAPPLADAVERNVVQVADPSLPAKRRSSDRNQINKNHRAGYEVRLLAGPETDGAQRADFLDAYEQTMRRAGAVERYFFGAAYFERILESDRTWLALAHAPDGAVAAASIVVQSDGFLHYYLSGSADAYLRDSPMKNVVATLVELSAERGLPLNLGGGIFRGDRLEEFKRGFANREQPWRCSEIVCDREAYDRLSVGNNPATDFFPLYRSGGS
jgi:Acetyltransferase (GNAT) domain